MDLGTMLRDQVLVQARASWLLIRGYAELEMLLEDTIRLEPDFSVRTLAPRVETILESDPSTSVPGNAEGRLSTHRQIIRSHGTNYKTPTLGAWLPQTQDRLATPKSSQGQ
jgi:hypothetical protein